MPNTVHVSTKTSFFDNLGGSSIEGNPQYPFRLRVLVAGYRVTPRHSMFEYFRELGMNQIPDILYHKRLKGKDLNFDFVFPERWMSVHEQSLFIHRLETHPDVAKIKSVSIITQNALIVGNIKQGSLAMFQLPEGDPEAGIMQQDIPVPTR